jgi:hypothetical protein
MLQSNEPNIFAREIFYGISFVGMGLKKKRARHIDKERADLPLPYYSGN